MTTIRLGGVPEHFNYPIHLAIADKLFAKAGIEVQWVEFPDGTGAMTKALRENRIDMALILTEGIIKDIAMGNPSKIIQNYVSSPLRWGIHVAANSRFEHIDDLADARVAISRMGSGSHVMAYVQAQEKGWDTSNLKLVTVGTMDGAIKALTNQEADYFMWEHFTTKPIVDRGVFRRLGNFPTPWSSFVIAVTQKFVDSQQVEVDLFLEILNGMTREFKEIPGIENEIAQVYGQRLEDVVKWLDLTSWSQEQLSPTEVRFVQSSLLSLEMIETQYENDFYLQYI